MTVARRLSRFGDWPTLHTSSQSVTVSGRQPFFAGGNVGSRMDQVRRAINDIRAHWDRYPVFMAGLREYMNRIGADMDELDSRDRERIAALFSSVKNWADQQAPSRTPDSGDDYSAIRLYTSEPGYRRIFSAINTAFRSVDLTKDTNALRSAAFLVELLSIDLFNYRHRHDHADNFEGVVYRGMCVSAAELAMFTRVATGPVQQRYLSIPLAMASASTDSANAPAFALEQARRHPDRYPLIWKIHVHALRPDLLDLYRSAFPSSTVTSLCAVPVDRLSDYPYEKEVLLRGPFFQILRLSRNADGQRDGKPIHTVEAVMLNSNRDHISTVASNEGEDRQARDLFRELVTVHRSALCADYCTAHGLHEDAAAYRSLLSSGRAAIDRHLSYR